MAGLASSFLLSHARTRVGETRGREGKEGHDGDEAVTGDGTDERRLSWRCRMAGPAAQAPATSPPSSPSFFFFCAWGGGWPMWTQAQEKARAQGGADGGAGARAQLAQCWRRASAQGARAR
ncbi:hypothetical protein Taro_028026 [Colocasia esculenta]|uniref:Uncharacterized protein n=1 Tax=Colocasia esculenta TaxID=4460 RepID=A0A843VP77_COLES|nr:hypothetical protein [Colocasia esculenta]